MKRIPAGPSIPLAPLWLVLVLLGITASPLYAQRISGTVTDHQGAPLESATLQWTDSSAGTLSGADGRFYIQAPGRPGSRLVASHQGFISDTMPASPSTPLLFRLRPNDSLQQVILVALRKGVVISDINPIKTEQITREELEKSACCDLAGCFETQTTVQPQVTNVITQSKELRIMGLSGVYNQVLIDGFPLIQGLSYTYGISSLPGTYIENIYVAKGANSVLQGYESISGQINLETREPGETDRLLLNVYANRFGESHLNTQYASRAGRWNQVSALHMVQPAGRFDRDGDRFLDLPLLQRYEVMQKWKYGREDSLGLNLRVGLRYFQERRVGGQMEYNEKTDRGSSQVYGQVVEQRQPEVWTKAAFRFNRRHQMVLFASSQYQRQESYFGTLDYNARQWLAYANAQYEWSHDRGGLKTGVSFRHLNLNERITFTDTIPRRSYDGTRQRRENIPGLFAEHTLRMLDDRLTWIAGIRLDRHNSFGWRFTPRTLVKYDITSRTILRANIGTGWRTANVFSENIGMLSSSRDLRFTEELEPETALNYGINLTQKFGSSGSGLGGQVSVDLYRTRFGNQIFPDYDVDPTIIVIRNFRGTSISNGCQAEVLFTFRNRFEWKTGYTYLDVYRIVDGKKQMLPFNARHRVLSAFSYKPPSGKGHIDLNLHGYGPQYLPNTSSNPAPYQRPATSPSYATLNVQFTLNVKAFECYAGCENVFDFRQRRPILSWEDPFGPYFDTSSVWGPTRGREFYAGIRYRIKK